MGEEVSTVELVVPLVDEGRRATKPHAIHNS
jgi:hypothetical protein